MSSSAWILLVSSLGVAPSPPITALAFAPGDASVLVGSQAGLEERSWPGLEVVRELETELSHIHDLVFSPRGDVLAAAGGAPQEAGQVELFRWPSGERIRTIDGHDDLVLAVAWRQDGNVFAAASADRTITLHKASTGQVLKTLRGHSRGAVGVGFAQDSVVVSAGIDQALRVWDSASGRQIRSLANHTQEIRGLAVRPGEHPGPPMVATAGADRTVRFWQPTIGRMVRLIKVDRVPLAIAWSRDGHEIAASCADGRLRLIDPDTASLNRDAPAMDGWAFSVISGPDGGYLVGGENGRLVWIDRDMKAQGGKTVRE